MAGGDAHARAAPEIPDGPRERRGRFQARIQAGGDAVGGQHASRLPREQLALVAAVVRNRNLFRQIGGVEVIGQSLRGLAHGVEVHPVGSRSDHAAQAAGSEGQIAVEAVVDGVGVALNGAKLSGQILRQAGLCQPAPVKSFYGIHSAHTPVFLNFQKAAIKANWKFSPAFFKRLRGLGQSPILWCEAPKKPGKRAKRFFPNVFHQARPNHHSHRGFSIAAIFRIKALGIRQGLRKIPHTSSDFPRIRRRTQIAHSPEKPLFPHPLGDP